MKLSELLSVFPQVRWGSGLDRAGAHVASIEVDSRRVNSESVFVAIRGNQSDGHKYISSLKDIPMAIVVSDAGAVPDSFQGACAVVDDTRKALSSLAAKFYGFPAKSIFSVAVTGTNGKTTTCAMIEFLLNAFGMPTGVMGTIDHHLQDRVWPSSLTTPDALLFQSRLREFIEGGAAAVAFEASSHALHQHRVDDSEVNVAVFTNLTRDHLDYHGSMEEYALAKARLFRELLTQSRKPNRTAIINADDAFGLELAKSMQCRVWAFGKSKVSDIWFNIFESGFEGSRFNLYTPMGERVTFLPMIGEHNIYNACAAIGVALNAGVSLEKSVEALANFPGVPGRLQRVSSARRIFVDYAHTDDGLRVVLSHLQEVRRQTSEKIKLITVFGCGGDRDKGKRPLMLATACRHSDQVVLTSDNPRSEDPHAIAADALKGADQEAQKRVVVELDRRQAIRLAIESAGPSDVILIAGKGHEKFQLIGDKKIEFDDVQVAREILEAHGE